MNNAHIELVKRWLADKDSVSRDELVANGSAASYAYAATAYVAADVSDAAYAASEAAYAAEVGFAADASYWVERYEELTNSR